MVRGFLGSEEVWDQDAITLSGTGRPGARPVRVPQRASQGPGDCRWRVSTRTALGWLLRGRPSLPAAGPIRWAGQWALGSRQAIVGPCPLSVPRSSSGTAPRGGAQDEAFTQLPVGATTCSCRQPTRAAASVARWHVPQGTGGRADLGRAGVGTGLSVASSCICCLPGRLFLRP